MRESVNKNMLMNATKNPNPAKFHQKIQTKRRLKNNVALTFSFLATTFGLFWLIWILASIISNSLNSLSTELFYKMTPPPHDVESGGLGNALVGSGLLIFWSTVFSAPLGIMAGIYLAEYGYKSWLAELIRFINDILLSTPSIMVGLFIYTTIVSKMKHFSGWSGAIALALLQIPIITRVSDSALKLVPNNLREAAYAIGVPKWKIIVAITLKGSFSSITTGIILSISRIAGETAPLLFTSLSNQFWSTDMAQPIANLPVTIFNFAMSPFSEWRKLAWSGVLIITICVLLLNILARLLLRRVKHL